MTILVGFGPEAHGRGGLELGRLLARSSQLPLVVCCVIPDRWGPVGPGRRVDAPYQAHLESLAESAIARAVELLDDTDLEVVPVVATARSVPTGLIEAAEHHRARVLVVGSSYDGVWGHIALGSVSDRLLHSSPLPVGLTPRGMRAAPGCRVTRISVAVDGTPDSLEVVTRAAAVARENAASIRLLSFAVRPRPMIPPELGLRIEDRVVAEWRRQTELTLEQALSTLDSGVSAEADIVEGESWAQALEEPEWTDSDVLVVGSSPERSRLARVFLGSTATRIVRHSPVPVIVVP